jgi:hypothetical protein
VVGAALSTRPSAHWKRLFDHLVPNKFFTVDKRGRQWRIKQGSRTLAAPEGASKVNPEPVPAPRRPNDGRKLRS